MERANRTERIRRVWALGMLSVTGWAGTAHAQTGRMCLVGATLVDPDQQRSYLGNVGISNGRVDWVDASNAPPRAGEGCAGAWVDLHGQFLLPGLVDLHVHPWGDPSPTDQHTDELDTALVAARFLAAGVTAMLDMGGDPRVSFSTRARLEGSLTHARFFTAGRMLFPGRFGGDETRLRTDVQALAAQRPDVVKIIFAEPGLGALLDEVRRQGLKSIVHISSWQEARVAVDAGATAITHFEDEVTIPSSLVKAMVRHRTASIPTLAVQCDMARAVDVPSVLNDPLLHALASPALLADYGRPATFTDKARFWVKWQRAGCVQHDFPSLRALAQAGVPVLAGSDTGNLGTFQGYSTHRELELMVEAGLSPWHALRAGTTQAAGFLNQPWGFHPGAAADFVVLRSSPIDDIRNTRAIAAVIRGGQRVAVHAPPSK